MQEPIAELLAIIGADVSPLTAQLAVAELKMRRTATNMAAEIEKINKAFAQGGAPAAMQQLLSLVAEEKNLEAQSTQALRVESAKRKEILAQEMASRAEYAAMTKAYLAEEAGRQIYGIGGHDDEVQRAIARAAVQRDVFERKDLEAQTTLAMKEEAARRKMVLAEEVASRAEYTAMIKAYALEEAEATRIADKEKLGHGALSGMGGGFMAGRELQAMTGGAYVFSRILGQLPIVQTAMNAAFDAVVVIAFLDILYTVDKEVEKMIVNWEGFGSAAQEAWSKAETGANEAMIKLIDYQRKMEDAKGLLSIAKETGHQYQADKYKIDNIADQHEIDKLQKQKTLLQETQLGPLDSKIDWYDKYLKMPSKMKSGQDDDKAAGIEKTITEDRKNQVELRKQEYDIADRIAKLRLDEVNREAQYLHQLSEEGRQIEKNSKSRDRIHELPYVLPWFMGARSSDFLTGGGSSRTVPHFTDLSPMRPGKVGRMSGAPSRVSSMSFNGGGGGVSFSPIFAPQYHFQGMPADAEAFVRDHMAPKLLSDMTNNARGMTREMIKVLQAHGVNT